MRLIHGDCTAEPVLALVRRHVDLYGKFPLVIADPPYGNILHATWDRRLRASKPAVYAAWLADMLHTYQAFCCPGAAAYIWGGIGKPGNRVFYRFIPMVEEATKWQLSNHITWAKKRAYGTRHNYLFAREEIAFFVLGDVKKPRLFNIPYLDKLRGYEGYNKKYPARSPYLRRTNVWSDVTELFARKLSAAEKPVALAEVMIKTHTEPGEWVLDLFSGAGPTGAAALKLNRRCLMIEKDNEECEKIEKRLGVERDKEVRFAV